MQTKKTVLVFTSACAAALLCAFSGYAQDDLDNLLNDLESKPKAKAPAKPEAKAEAKVEVEAPKVEVRAEEKKEEVAEAKVEEKEEKKEEVAEAPKAEVEAPKVEVKAEEKKEEVAEAKVEEKKEKKEEVAEAPKAEAKAEVEAPKAEVKAEEKKEEVAEAKPAAPAPAAKAVAHPDAELISDIAATEALRRGALDRQAEAELKSAREAMAEKDWEAAARWYRLAFAHLNDRTESRPLKKECAMGVAEARYQNAREALRNGDRDMALTLAQEAKKLRHPKADLLIASVNAKEEEVTQADNSAISQRLSDQDYKDGRDRNRRRLRLASQYLAVADLSRALEQCELVLVDDPDNREAITLRERIQRRREIILEQEREATRKGMMADINKAWRGVYAVDSAELKNVEGATGVTPVGADPERSMEQAIERRMKEIMLPSISFRPPATIIDAVDYFRQASKDYDRPEIPVDQRGLNFVLDGIKITGGASGGEEKAADDNSFAASADDGNAAAAANPDIPQIPNISTGAMSLWEALSLVCKISGFKFKIEKSVVIVMPKEMTTDAFETRSYNVTGNFLEKMSGATSDMKEMKAGSFGSSGSEGEEEAAGNQEAEWKALFEAMGVQWPKGSRIMYLKVIGKLRVSNTAENLALFEAALQELNMTPSMIEIEARFVEVAQEDLNSLGFEWLLNSDYSFGTGKLGKILGLKKGEWDVSDADVAAGTLIPSYSKTDNDVLTTTTTSDTTTVPDMRGTGTTSTQTTVQNVTDVLTETTDTTYTKASGSGRTWQRGTGKGHNMGLNAINGTDYSTGMRYLSTEGNHISGEGNSSNDQFLRVNAFLGNADLSMILHMLSQRSDTDLLSAPKVLTIPGQEATMKVVTEYIYPTDYDVTIQSTSSGSSSSSSSSSGGSDGKILPMVEPQNFQMREVGVILQVTPDLAAEGNMINLDIKPQIVSEPTWKDYGMKVPMSVVMSSTESAIRAASGSDMEWFTVPMEQPFFKVRSIETHVSVYNGATVVMGGLITEDRKSMEDKIPFLGDIPYIGRFFRSRSEWSEKKNLLVFVTARLVDPRGRQLTLGQGDGAAAPAPTAAAPAPAAAPAAAPAPAAEEK